MRGEREEGIRKKGEAKEIILVHVERLFDRGI